MSANIICIDFQQLEQLTQRFDEHHESTDNLVKRLQSTSDDLRSRGWEGEGARAFFAEFDDDVLPRVKRLSRALDEASATLRQIIDIMADAEQHAGSLFDGDNGIINPPTGPGLPLPPGTWLPPGFPIIPGPFPPPGGGIWPAPPIFPPGTWPAPPILPLPIPGPPGFMPLPWPPGAGVMPLPYPDIYEGQPDYSSNDFWNDVGKVGLNMMADELVEYGAVKGAGEWAARQTTQEGFQRVLDTVGGSGFTRGVDIGKGFAGGVLDFAYGGDYSVREFGVQTASGVLQAVAFPPGVQIADAGFQIMGNVIAEGVEQNAMWLANGDPARAASIAETANRFQSAVGAVSIDARFDGMVDSAFRGDLGGVANELGTFAVGTGGVLVEGTQMIGQVGFGVAEQTFDFVADNAPQVMEGIGNTVSDVGDAISDMGDVVGGVMDNAGDTLSGFGDAIGLW
jgi:WXG100 family type VII secretion target